MRAAGWASGQPTRVPLLFSRENFTGNLSGHINQQMQASKGGECKHLYYIRTFLDRLIITI